MSCIIGENDTAESEKNLVEVSLVLLIVCGNPSWRVLYYHRQSRY